MHRELKKAWLTCVDCNSYRPVSPLLIMRTFFADKDVPSLEKAQAVTGMQNFFGAAD